MRNGHLTFPSITRHARYGSQKVQENGIKHPGKLCGDGEKRQELRQMKVTITAQDVDNSEERKGST